MTVNSSAQLLVPSDVEHHGMRCPKWYEENQEGRPGFVRMGLLLFEPWAWNHDWRWTTWKVP